MARVRWHTFFGGEFEGNSERLYFVWPGIPRVLVKLDDGRYVTVGVKKIKMLQAARPATPSVNTATQGDGPDVP